MPLLDELVGRDICKWNPQQLLQKDANGRFLLQVDMTAAQPSKSERAAMVKSDAQIPDAD